MFGPGTAARVADALAALPRLTGSCEAGAAAPALQPCGASAGVPALVLDLRDNPGGSLAEGAATAAQFEPLDEVFMSVAARESDRQTLRIADVLAGANPADGDGSPAPPWAQSSAPPIVRPAPAGCKPCCVLCCAVLGGKRLRVQHPGLHDPPGRVVTSVRSITVPRVGCIWSRSCTACNAPWDSMIVLVCVCVYGQWQLDTAQRNHAANICGATVTC